MTAPGLPATRITRYLIETRLLWNLESMIGKKVMILIHTRLIHQTVARDLKRQIA
jgi:hypothetical protein